MQKEKHDKKILTVTIWDSENYGNRLQAYALNRLLQRDIHCEVYNLVYGYYEPPGRRIKKEVKMAMACLGVKKYRHLKNERRISRKNEHWNQQHFPRQILAGDRYRNLQQIDFTDFDYVITGSDQVWHNWNRQERELDYYYLQFVPEEKRLCFSPSFGFESVPDSDLLIHQRGLDGMPVLSCREHSGCEMIRQLTGRTARWIPDPTLCLERKDWEQLAAAPAKSLPEKYVLKFYLGGINDEIEDSIASAARRLDAAIIDIGRYTADSHYEVDAGNFLWLIQHASLICTDSFHATVFSIVFRRDFFTFRRNGLPLMFDRFQTLLNLFGLEDRIVQNNTFTYTPIAEERFFQTEENLRYCREQALDYLSCDCRLVSYDSGFPVSKRDDD